MWPHILIVAAAVAATDEAVGVAPDPLELAVIAARRQLVSGRVRIESEMTYPTRGEEIFRKTYELLFEGDSLRESETLPLLQRSPDAADAPTPARRVETRHDGRRLQTVVTPAADGAPLAVLGNKSGRVREHLFDARVFGLWPSGTPHLHNMTLDAYVAHSRRTSVAVRDDAVDGVPCPLVSYQRPDESRCQIWIDRARGPSVVQAETQYTHAGKSGRDRIQSRLAEWPVGPPDAEPTGAVWYPAAVTFDRFSDDRHLIHEVATVAEARFQIPVQPEEFGPAGMNLLPGTVVADSNQPGPVAVWDGQQLAPLRRPPPDPDETPPERGMHWKWWLSLNLAVAAALCFALCRRPRRKASGTQAAPPEP